MNFKDVTKLVIPQGEVIQIQDSLSRILWKKATPSVNLPFYIENHTTSDRTVYISKSTTTGAGISVYYSNDNVTWTSMGTTSYNVDITAPLPANGRTYLRCSTAYWSDYNTIRTNLTTALKVGGNIMSLLYGASYAGRVSFPSGSANTFKGTFKFNISDASELILPATTLAESCYQAMFYGQTSLISAPQLPATTLAKYCYSYMFSGCTSLVVAPELPATTLAQDCYSGMFRGCTSLNSIKCLATNISAYRCLVDWMKNVPSGGTFVKKAGVEWPTGESGIPSGWTVVEV